VCRVWRLVAVQPLPPRVVLRPQVPARRGRAGTSRPPQRLSKSQSPTRRQLRESLRVALAAAAAAHPEASMRADPPRTRGGARGARVPAAEAAGRGRRRARGHRERDQREQPQADWEVVLTGWRAAARARAGGAERQPGAQSGAAYVIYTLVVYNKAGHAVIAFAGAVPPLIVLLHSPLVAVREHAVAARRYRRCRGPTTWRSRSGTRAAFRRSSSC
jgi:hypothetical protein